MAGMVKNRREVGSESSESETEVSRSALADCRSGPNIAVSNVEVYPALPQTIFELVRILSYIFILSIVVSTLR